MTIRRYGRSPVIKFGQKYGTSYAINAIRINIESGNIRYSSHILAQNERLDILAGEYYNEGTYWWIIAAASGIGWGLQVPPGTLLKVPFLEDLARYIG
jgi:hypothetical protein